MRRWNGTAAVLAAASLAIGATGAWAAGAPKKAKGQAAPPAVGVIEPRAVEILKAMSDRLSAARSLSFRAVASYESPSNYGPPLVYLTDSRVTLARPDRLRVVTVADGPRAEFYYDGKTMSAYAPEEKLLASAPAPATIDEMLKSIYEVSGTYFPFTDLIVANAYGDIAAGLKLAFVVGQSQVEEDVTTDVVAYESDGVFVQLWVGAEDKLPRRARAIFYDDRLRLRHDVQISDWAVNPDVSGVPFAIKAAEGVATVEFANPKTRQAPAAEAGAKKTKKAN